jgi:hypothetical protein
MSSRPLMLALALIAALATTGLATTSTLAFGDGSVRFSHRGISSFAQRLDPYKTSKFRPGAIGKPLA